MGRRWVRILGAVAVLVVIAALVWANRKEIPSAAHALRTAHGSWLWTGGGLLVLWCANWTLLHAAARRVTGVGGYGEVGPLVPVTLASVALNLAVKSGNIAGLAAFVMDGRRRGLRSGSVTAAYLVAAQLAEVTFIVTLSIGMALVWADGRLTRVEIFAVVVFLTGLVVRVVSLVAAVRDRETLRRVWTWPARTLDRMLGRPQGDHDTTHADDLYDAVAALRARPLAALPAVGFAIAVDLLGAAVLWASMAAVGVGDEPAVALVAYAVSTLFGIVGVLPGGVGFGELGAVAILASYGSPVGVAAAAVVVFRVFVFWIPLAAGGLIAWCLRRHAGDRH